MTDGTECFDHARRHVDFLLQNSPIYAHLFSSIRLVTASSSSVVTNLSLEPFHLNSKGSLHGSITATIVDFMGGLAIACFDLRPTTGVSTSFQYLFMCIFLLARFRWRMQ